MSDWLTLLEGKVSPEDLERARQEKYYKRSPADFLLSNRFVTPQILLSALSRHYNLPSILLDRCQPDGAALEKISEDVARRFLMLPLFQIEGRLYVALSNPEDLASQDYVSKLTGLSIEPILATRSSLERAINRHFVSKEQSAKTFGKMTAEETKEAPGPPGELRVEDRDAPAVKLTTYILSQGIRLGASDIHLEPFEDRALLRYRVDGVLHEFPPPPFELSRALVARMKVLSNLDITERRLPQDGRTRVQVDNRFYDLRISIIPNLYGESMVVRILDPGGSRKELLDHLGFSPALLAGYNRLISKPYGILLVTGPTGSGKTSTLYATLKHLLTPKKKIITLEDPIEYQLYGVTQFQVNPEIDFTFAKGLRSVLRHDPDIVMLGEIRDLESAEIAVQSSLTGHLVLSTLHTNDAPSAVTRLVDMGVQPFMIMASLIGVLAQRLLRRLCPRCKQEYVPSAGELTSIARKSLRHGTKLFRPIGCNECNNLGYKGRMAVGELLEITGEMRRLPPDMILPETLRKLAIEQEFIPLRESALDALFSGLTSLEEVLSVTMTTS